MAREWYHSIFFASNVTCYVEREQVICLWVTVPKVALWVMGFNRRKMEDKRRAAAEKEAAARRATEVGVKPRTKNQ